MKSLEVISSLGNCILAKVTRISLVALNITLNIRFASEFLQNVFGLQEVKLYTVE